MKIYNEIPDIIGIEYITYFIIEDNNRWEFTNPLDRDGLWNDNMIVIFIIRDSSATWPDPTNFNLLYQDLLNEEMNSLDIAVNEQKYIRSSKWKLRKDSYFFINDEISYNNLLQLQRKQKIEKIKQILDND
jgi:hypothetical protein